MDGRQRERSGWDRDNDEWNDLELEERGKRSESVPVRSIYGRSYAATQSSLAT